MGKLSKDEVKYLAKLAKLSLSSSEINIYQKQLSEVVNFISQLKEVETGKVEATSQTTGLENVFRPDEIKNEDSLNQEEALSGTDEIHNSFFKVSAVFEEK